MYIEVLKNVMHTVNAMELVECRCLVILALTCLPILRDSGFVSTKSLGGKPVTVLCVFLLACGKSSCVRSPCFKISCEETSHHSKNDRRQSTTSVPSIVALYLRALLRLPYRRRQADGARSTPAPICGASGDLPVGPQHNELKHRQICGDVSGDG